MSNFGGPGGLGGSGPVGERPASLPGPGGPAAPGAGAQANFKIQGGTGGNPVPAARNVGPAGGSAGHQAYLDPRSAHATFGPIRWDTDIPVGTGVFLDGSQVPRHWIPDTLPQRVRQFGFLPDVSNWLPGDLILVSATRLSLAHVFQRITNWVTIRTQQKGGFHLKDARWQHAAVYLDGYTICEALPFEGVRCSSLMKYVGRHLIRVRRDPSLSADDQFRIALDSLKRLRLRYDYFALARILWRAFTGFLSRSLDQDWRRDNAFHCSRHYLLAYTGVTGKLLNKVSPDQSVPADLSAAGELQDVGELRWLQISTATPVNPPP